MTYRTSLPLHTTEGEKTTKKTSGGKNTVKWNARGNKYVYKERDVTYKNKDTGTKREVYTEKEVVRKGKTKEVKKLKNKFGITTKKIVHKY
tara:strand:- start:525 stop:797 length:273 start_codon:yes stop_codon:yes gene_type:complete